MRKSRTGRISLPPIGNNRDMNGVMEIPVPDYSALDRPEVTRSLFHPRPEPIGRIDNAAARDISIPVDDGVVLGARFFAEDQTGPNILFFHGNGEIVADYDELGELVARMEINFLPVDYRGYGRSTGQPSVTAMMGDCHIIFDFVVDWLKLNAFTGPLVLMGRSLGSASVLELAVHYSREIDALIVESGFAHAGPLLELLGIDIHRLGFTEERGFRNIDKIRAFEKPVLIVHAERDHIIPFSEGRALFEACVSREKKFLKIPGANHNDILFHGLKEYLAAIKKLTDDL